MKPETAGNIVTGAAIIAGAMAVYFSLEFLFNYDWSKFVEPTYCEQCDCCSSVPLEEEQ